MFEVKEIENGVRADARYFETCIFNCYNSLTLSKLMVNLNET